MHCGYHNNSKGFVILLVYAEDILLTGNDELDISSIMALCQSSLSRGGFVCGVDNDESFYPFQSLNGICFEAQIFSFFFFDKREGSKIFVSNSDEFGFI